MKPTVTFSSPIISAIITTVFYTYPFINSPIQITRVEVWITNRQSQTNNIRNIVALQDLGIEPERTRLGGQLLQCAAARCCSCQRSQ